MFVIGPQLLLLLLVWKKNFFQNSGAPLCSCAPITETDIVPQFWKMTLISGKVTSPLKSSRFEAVEINFGLQLFFLLIGNGCCIHFCEKIDKNRPYMTVATAHRKHCRVYGVATLYPVLAHSNRETDTAMY